MEERTERRGQNESQIEEEKWQACWRCRDQQRACRMTQASAEKLEHTGPAEKERVASVPQRMQMASTPEPPLAIRRRNRAVSPEYQIMREKRESRWARAAPWREKGGSEQEHEEERVDSTVKEGREGKQQEPP